MCTFFSEQKKMGLGFYAIYSKSRIITEYLVSSTSWNMEDASRHLQNCPLERHCPVIQPTFPGTTHFLSGSHYLECSTRQTVLSEQEWRTKKGKMFAGLRESRFVSS